MEKRGYVGIFLQVLSVDLFVKLEGGEPRRQVDF